MKNTLENFFIVWYSTPCVNVPIAQLVEHRTLNPQVVGSIPTGDTEILKAISNDIAFNISVYPRKPTTWLSCRDRIGVAKSYIFVIRN